MQRGIRARPARSCARPPGAALAAHPPRWLCIGGLGIGQPFAIATHCQPRCGPAAHRRRGAGLPCHVGRQPKAMHRPGQGRSGQCASASARARPSPPRAPPPASSSTSRTLARLRASSSPARLNRATSWLCFSARSVTSLGVCIAPLSRCPWAACGVRAVHGLASSRPPVQRHGRAGCRRPAPGRRCPMSRCRPMAPPAHA